MEYENAEQTNLENSINEGKYSLTFLFLPKKKKSTLLKILYSSCASYFRKSLRKCVKSTEEIAFLKLTN